jgi:hypothetical protein
MSFLIVWSSHPVLDNLGGASGAFKPKPRYQRWREECSKPEPRPLRKRPSCRFRASSPRRARQHRASRGAPFCRRWVLAAPGCCCSTRFNGFAKRRQRCSEADGLVRERLWGGGDSVRLPAALALQSPAPRRRFSTRTCGRTSKNQDPMHAAPAGASQAAAPLPRPAAASQSELGNWGLPAADLGRSPLPQRKQHITPRSFRML